MLKAHEVVDPLCLTLVPCSFQSAPSRQATGATELLAGRAGDARRMDGQDE